ncbi:glycosyltransferase family 2 protein [uncultured Chitinophaga sp.]|uniref:glycosyltransferase family 2 protein n=1 Tax=uncultured Chitinophaga sp. TaxID=339340 RepID=UPI0025DAF600|nr:glycosyltransferase family 2 protein [uncultured Chitinophaga sp.]
MSKKVSIIVPVYNGAQFISETLDSIYNQHYRNIELIVIDGASTDNTVEVVKAHKQQPDILISEKDKGMYDALRKGCERATGDYMCYINSDDRLLPYTLEQVVHKFETEKCDLVFGDVNYINETGDVIFMYKGVNFGYKAIKEICRVPFAQQSSFWTRDIYLKTGGFDSSLKYVADSKFLLQICLDPSVKKAYIPHPLGEYRLHGASFSVSVTDKMIVEHGRVMEQLELKRSGALWPVYEFYAKLVNLGGIYKKMTYKGTKF